MDSNPTLPISNHSASNHLRVSRRPAGGQDVVTVRPECDNVGFEGAVVRRPYCCFYLAAVTDLRHGEVLALRWRHVDFERQCVAVCEAWKEGKEMGPPKWDHLRVGPLLPITVGPVQVDTLTL